MSTDDEWPDPDPGRRRLSPRVRVRLACSAVVAVVLLVVFWEYVVTVVPRLWPPRTPLSRWATLVLLQAFGFVLVPVSVGSFLGDFLYERYVE